ncbi:MAG: hypothetical protein GXW85_01915 [Clostridia bacterium]|nr:hypothetical protein [Clostridia bacterium]
MEYKKVGEFLKTAMRFGYFYLWVKKNDSVLIPRYTDEGLKFGSLKDEEILQNEFAKKYITSQASAAIEANSFTAEEGMLHEVEFISPYTLDEGKPVFFRGLLWVAEISDDNLSIADLQEDDFIIRYSNKSIKFSELAKNLQVGGERKYGFGLLKMEGKPKKEGSNDFISLGYNGTWKEKNGEVYISIREKDPIWSHVKNTSDLKIKGEVELFIGRDWSDKGAGRELNVCGLCWSPGSILLEEKSFKITRDFGLWEI